MRASAQFRAGLIEASRVTGISIRQASIRAGFNENQIARFLGGGHDIKLETLDAICTGGFGLTFETVYRMGQ